MTSQKDTRPVSRAHVALAVLVLLVLLPGSLRAQSHHDDLLGRHLGRAQMATEADGENAQSAVRNLPHVPDDFIAWWNPGIHQVLNDSSLPIQVNVESLILSALRHSAQIRVAKEAPLIRSTAVIEADAEFDWTAFVNTRWNDINEPVGNTLTVGGGLNRLSDHNLEYSMGLRRQTKSGGDLQISQDFGYQDNNSIYFVPTNQGTAQFRVSYTQPLLNGHGAVYNTSLILLAQIDSNIAEDELSQELQTHLLEITRVYWNLYLERGALLQKKRLYQRAQEILAELEPRVEIDAPINQVARARAAVAARASDLLRSEMAVRNAQSRINALVNDPALVSVEGAELVPLDQPTRTYVPIGMRESLTTALQHRPEIGQALKQIKSAATRLDMSEHELLPVLNLVMEAYASGLSGSSDVGRAFGNQFREGGPSYAVGLQFEYPLRNRAAYARRQRRKLELRQVSSQLDATAENVMADVEIAVREVNTSYREMGAKFQSMLAADAEVNYIQQRWIQLVGDDRTGSLVLEDLLSAQERLTEAEFGFLRAQVTYSLSLMNVKKAVGILLEHEQITIGHAEINHLPEIILDKPVNRAAGGMEGFEVIPGAIQNVPAHGYSPTYQPGTPASEMPIDVPSSPSPPQHNAAPPATGLPPRTAHYYRLPPKTPASLPRPTAPSVVPTSPFRASDHQLFSNPPIHRATDPATHYRWPPALDHR